MKTKVIRALAAFLIGGIFMLAGSIIAYGDEAYPPQDEPPTAMEVATEMALPIFPVQVEEHDFGNMRRVIRTYELTDYEDPARIRTESFEREGFYFTMSEITRNRASNFSVRQHTEKVEIVTSSQSPSVVLAELNGTLEFEDEDGYVGILTLDIASINTVTTGHRTINRTTTETRTFSNLSSTDASLIPSSITVGGNTLPITDIQWASGSGQMFTATATYSGTRAIPIHDGYLTTANFHGELTRIANGESVFKVIFTGVPLHVETATPAPVRTASSLESQIEELQQELSYVRDTNENAESVEEYLEAQIEELRQELTYIQGASGTTETLTPQEPETREPREPINISWLGVFIVLVILSAAGAGVYFIFIRGNVKVHNLVDGEDYAYLGRTKVSKRNRVIDLTSFTERARTASFTLELGRLAVTFLKGATVTINYGGNTFQHIVNCDKVMSKYSIPVEF